MPALREARRLNGASYIVYIMAHICYTTLITSYLISEVILGIDSRQLPMINDYHLLILVFAVIPLSCLSCLDVPWDYDVLMKRMVLNRRMGND